MKNISILGSTGSIGVNALNVIDNLNDKFNVKALSAYKNSNLLVKQTKKYNPEIIAIVDSSKVDYVKDSLKGSGVSVLHGREGLLELSSRSDVDIMFNSLVGSSGMQPTINAIRSSVDVALSNKESLVMAGDIINNEKNKSGAKIFPVDSEHSAIFQCLHGEPDNSLKKIILTGSGGPFLERPLDSFDTITKEEALNHPKWNMGNKISIDSATMMNKGLEYVEALWLFGINTDQLDIVIHPQSIIHSFVQFIDDSYKAQLGVPDMKVPIQYALSYPERMHNNFGTLNFSEINQFTFSIPDMNRYPCLQLAIDLVQEGGNSVPIMSIANDHVVELFLNDRISFIDIPKTIEKTVKKFQSKEKPNAKDLIQLNQEIKVYLDSN